LNINVTPAPQIISSITNNVPNLALMWTGGIEPFQVEMSTDLTTWINLGGPISSNLFMIAPTNPAAFYRIVGQ
jgi:hypothetical protein